jgi:hypothetical protein
MRTASSPATGRSRRPRSTTTSNRSGSERGGARRPGRLPGEAGQVRKLTDASATTLESLSGVTGPNVSASLQQFEAQFRQLAGYRTAVDDGSATQQQAYDDYTGLISSNLSLFTALTQTGIAEIDVITRPRSPPAGARR